MNDITLTIDTGEFHDVRRALAERIESLGSTVHLSLLGPDAKQMFHVPMR
jgi:hypothetical protein